MTEASAPSFRDMLSFLIIVINRFREKQLDIKRWQVKEAEKQRVVKLSSADWIDHPDRYLLELAGRPTYSNAENK